MAERTTIEGYDIEQDFTGFSYTKLKAMYRHPRIKALKADGVVRVAGMSYWKGPAWYILVGQALNPDDDLHATFVNDSQGEAKVLVVREGVGLTIDGIEVLRKLLPRRSLELFDLGRKVGEMHILRLGSGNGPLYPHGEALEFLAGVGNLSTMK
jgi:hypothetical protein